MSLAGPLAVRVTQVSALQSGEGVGIISPSPCSHRHCSGPQCATAGEPAAVVVHLWSDLESVLLAGSQVMLALLGSSARRRVTT